MKITNSEAIGKELDMNFPLNTSINKNRLLYFTSHKYNLLFCHPLRRESFTEYTQVQRSTKYLKIWPFLLWILLFDFSIFEYSAIFLIYSTPYKVP